MEDDQAARITRRSEYAVAVAPATCRSSQVLPDSPPLPTSDLRKTFSFHRCDGQDQSQFTPQTKSRRDFVTHLGYGGMKGDVSVNVDARACFLPISFFADPTVVKHDPWSRAKRVRVGGMSLKHTFEVSRRHLDRLYSLRESLVDGRRLAARQTPISPQTSLIWQGQMMARNGAGGGNVVGTLRHAFGPRLWIEVCNKVVETSPPFA